MQTFGTRILSRIGFALLASTCLFVLLASSVFADGLDIAYTLPRASQVSINVYDAAGHVVRELLHAAPRPAGSNRETWDCLDYRGKPASAGRYTWKLLSTQGLTASYVMTLGTNPTPAWATWPGNHGGIGAVAAADGAMYVASGGEGTISVVKQSLDGGTRFWTVPNWMEAWTGATSMGKGGASFYILHPNGHLFRLDDSTGAVQQMWDEKWGATADTPVHPLIWLGADIAMAASADQVVISYYQHDAIRWIDPGTGKVLDEAAIPKPLGVAAGADGHVYVVSDTSVVELSRANKSPRTLVTGLTGAYRIAVDPASGDFFVAETVGDQQVKRYKSDGTFVRDYGIRGGRPTSGLYDPMGFNSLNDIAADGQGGFLVAEEGSAPRRTVHFDSAGQIVREWIGPEMYSSFASVDPADPTLVWGDSQFGSIIQYKVDYAARTWKVRATYYYAGLASGLVDTHQHGTDSWYIRHRGQKTYMCRNNRPEILEVDEPGRRLIPRAAYGMSVPWGPSSVPIVVDYIKQNGNAEGKNFFIWRDLNGDGQASLDEMIPNGNVNPWLGGSIIDKDMNYTLFGGSADYISVVPYWIKDWTATGAPEYQAGPARLAPTKTMNVFGGVGNAVTDSAGNYYGIATTIGSNDGNRFAKFDRDGNFLWMVGSSAAGSVARPGEVKRLYTNVGITHNCDFVTDDWDQMVHIWDTDGLWVGNLFDHIDLSVAPKDAYHLGSENFNGFLYTNPTTGNVLYFGVGQNNTPVYRVTGWDQIVRMQGAIVLVNPVASRPSSTPPSTSTAPAPAAVAQPAAPIAPVEIASAPRIAIDGSLDDWKNVTPLQIMDGKDVRALLYLAWSDKGLFAAYDVTTDRPWKSASATPQLAFQGGASVDLSLGPLDPERTGAVVGDLRIVVAPHQKSPEVVALIPRLPADWAGAASPATYETGQGKMTFDSVAPLPGAVASIRLKPGNAGYVVELFVPTGELIPHRLGARFRLDASVTLADTEGAASAARLSWHSRDASDAMLMDTYTQVLLRPQNWATVELK